ncbi:magnesium-translocating P-type ATPase [Nocardioides sp. zg-DK7169]|uniref:magnesium-translocating P-type ATPase n=1 Tax=Nocardioides sp. zg-DK7169 TaxID=2736600 RepID=UPI0015568107|nr:magnesium-translocating P-type ATPase [Nocardioides sp. zg-DK7169]NPC97390.1 magnesium-translocating P-type ATPase [Nocardioides sp. zg-DK7169]
MSPQTRDLDTFWAEPAESVLRALEVDEAGLSADEAARRLDTTGPNRLAPARHRSWVVSLAQQFADPVILILVFASLVSLVLRDVTDAAIILTIVALSGLLGFYQEHRASVEMQRLLALVQVHADLRRDGAPAEVALEEVVPGDLVVLKAGDVVPGDCRLVSADALQVDQAALTGETFPQHKQPAPVPAETALAGRHDVLYLGSHVVSGRGLAVVVATGAQTELGRLSGRLEESAPATGFERGVRSFGLLLARVTFVLALVILALNLTLERPFAESLLFSLALAVGLTPQMLPAIISVSLATGARRMAAKQVIVRRLDAIEDFGAMDVLCTDKTGTLTEGTVQLRGALDPSGAESDEVLALAALNAGLQGGYANPIDTAILATRAPDPSYAAVDEVAYDFTRKRLSVLVEGPDGRRLVCKGAYDSVVGVCAAGTPREELDARFRELSDAGFRVLALARRELPGVDTVTVEDERDLEFAGFLVLADPPKQDASRVLGELAAAGIGVRMITGDNRRVAAHVAGEVGLDPTGLLTGSAIESLDEDELVARARETQVFAEVDPSQKERIIRALRSGGAIVGYLGDGINDAGALHLADVGISVDTAVDVAKSAAAIVLMDKDLSVLEHGVQLGRQTFANTLKYVMTTVSANFGNVISMVIASAFLPFLPLLPRQILLLNFLSDIPSTTIAADTVDPEQRERPQRWDIGFIRDFMVLFGLLSTAFDLLTFAVLLQVFDSGSTLFRSAWFVGSTLTELTVLLVLRTRRPAYRSRPGRGLLITSAVVAVVTIAIPYSPAASVLGLRALPAAVLGSLLLITLAYVVAAETIKHSFYRAIAERAARPPRALGSPAARVRSRRLRQVVREHSGWRGRTG